MYAIDGNDEERKKRQREKLKKKMLLSRLNACVCDNGLSLFARRDAYNET